MDDNFINELHRTDPWVAAITPERIGRALQDFPLPLAEGWDLARLTVAIQDRVGFARGRTEQGDAAALKQLRRAFKLAENLHEAIASLGDTAERAAFWELPDLLERSEGAQRIDYERDYRPAMLDSVETVRDVLLRATWRLAARPPQGPRWTETDAAERRTGFAVALMSVFESAFGKAARANNWKAEYGEEHEWATFFRAIYMELFPDVEALNLAKTLQEAARLRPEFQAFKRALYQQDATRDKIAGE